MDARQSNSAHNDATSVKSSSTSALVTNVWWTSFSTAVARRNAAMVKSPNDFKAIHI